MFLPKSKKLPEPDLVIYETRQSRIMKSGPKIFSLFFSFFSGGVSPENLQSHRIFCNIKCKSTKFNFFTPLIPPTFLFLRKLAVRWQHQESQLWFYFCRLGGAGVGGRASRTIDWTEDR